MDVRRGDGTHRAGGKAHPVRLALGELAVPVEALAGISFEPDRKGGRLRLRLRGGACPVLRAADGRLKDGADPYALAVERTARAWRSTSSTRSATRC